MLAGDGGYIGSVNIGEKRFVHFIRHTMIASLGRPHPEGLQRPTHEGYHDREDATEPRQSLLGPGYQPIRTRGPGRGGCGYAKFVTDPNGQAYWSIHAGDGTQLGAAQSLELAWAAIRQNDLEPVSVH